MAHKKQRTSPPATSPLVRQAIELYQARNHQGARTFCLKALDIDPQDAEALHLLGVIELETQGAAVALPLLLRATHANPRDPFSRIDLARALGGLERYAEAEQALRDASKQAPRLPAVVFNLGSLLDAQGRYELADKQYRRALELEPRFAECWIALGNNQGRRQELKDAETSYRKALSIDPGQEQARANLAHVLKQQGRIKEAEQSYRALIAASPRNAQAQRDLGVLLHEDDRAEEALACFKSALAIDPQLTAARYSNAVLRADQGHVTDAIALFEQIIREDPAYLDAWHDLGLMLLQEDRVDDAIAHYGQLEQRAPDKAMTHAGLSAAWARCAQLEAAETAARKAIEADPDNLVFQVSLLDLLVQRDKQAEASRLQQHLFATRAHADVHRELGRRHLSRGRYLEARAHYLALAQCPGEQAASAEVGPLSLALGEVDADAWGNYAGFVNAARGQPGLALSEPLPADMTGRSVLLKAEQGIGDELFFLRFAPELAGRGAKVWYRATAKTAVLLKPQALGFAHVIAPEEPSPAADHEMWIQALPHALRAGNTPSAEPFPAALPLVPQPARTERLARMLERLGPPPYIGVTWRAGAGEVKLKLLRRGMAFLAKKAPLEALGTALAGLNATFLVLQRNPEAGEIERFSRALGDVAHDLTALNDDLDDMLALLQLIHDYVGVSNTNMHLVAGLGKSARVLVPCPPEWRWMATGDLSPWFKGFRVYRQTALGDWREPLRRLSSDLAAQFGRKPAAEANEPTDAVPVQQPTARSSDANTAQTEARSGGTISEAYRRMQQELHRNPNYGVASVEFAPTVAGFIKTHRIGELLDYGAGKGRLGQELQKLVQSPLSIRHYEPAVPEWSAAPPPCEFVASIDVLEHIEPDLLDNVLDDLKRVVLRFGLFTIATGPAGKILPDGRNAHLIQQPAAWWLPKLMARFELSYFNRIPRGFLVVVEPKS